MQRKSVILIILIFLVVLINNPAWGEEEIELQKLYDAALYLYKVEKYEFSRLIFQILIDRYPASKLTDNAQFWKGISYYKENKYNLALEELKKVIKDYPQGNKLNEALRKIEEIKKLKGEGAQSENLEILLINLEKALKD